MERVSKTILKSYLWTLDSIKAPRENTFYIIREPNKIMQCPLPTFDICFFVIMFCKD